MRCWWAAATAGDVSQLVPLPAVIPALAGVSADRAAARHARTMHDPRISVRSVQR